MLLAAHFQTAGSIRNLARLDTRSDGKRDRRKHQRKGKPEAGPAANAAAPCPPANAAAFPKSEQLSITGNAQHIECLPLDHTKWFLALIGGNYSGHRA